MEMTIEQALQQGVASHKEGRLQEAEGIYRAILKAQPKHPDANHNLGVLAVSVKRASAALPFFRTAIEANPEVEQFWLSYVKALIIEKQWTEARQAITDAKRGGILAAKLNTLEEQLQREPSSIGDIPLKEIRTPLHSHEDALSLAIELRELGRYRASQEVLRKIIGHEFKNAEVLSLMSQVLLLDGKELEAEKMLTAAVSINADLPSVYRNQARLLLKKSKASKALEKAKLGCEQSPKDPESLLVLATCLGANQRDMEALPIIEKILQSEPNYAEAYANRALIKSRASDTIGAIKDAKMAVSLKPHMTRVWQLLSSLYLRTKNLSDACEALRCAYRTEPENPDLMVQLGELLRQDNKANEAIVIVEKATELAPENAEAWTTLALAFQQEKRLAEAKKAYEKALTLSPKSAIIFSNLGAIAKYAEQWESAVQYFEKALEVEPKFAEAHYNLGTTLKELGRLEEAEASFNKAIFSKPNFAEAYGNLGATLEELGRLNEAEASYDKALALNPDCADFLYNRHCIPKKREDAEYWIDKCLEADKEYLKATLMKAALRFYSGAEARFENLMQSELKDHPYVRSFAWAFSLPKLPELSFNRWHFYDAIIEKSTTTKPFYEFGVWRASSFRYLIKYFKKGYGFDTFSGLPEDWDLGSHIEKKGKYTSDGLVPEIPGGEFIVGKFEETLPVFFSQSRPKASVINFDADLYSSTACALNFARKVMDKDTILIFDQLLMNESWEQDEFKALQEFCSVNRLSYEVINLSFNTKQVAVKLRGI